MPEETAALSAKGSKSDGHTDSSVKAELYGERYRNMNEEHAICAQQFY